MKNEILLLTGLELKSLRGINRFRYTKNKKEKNGFLRLATAWVIVFAMLVFYIYYITETLWLMGLRPVVPAYMTAVCSVMIFVLSLLTASRKIFAKKGYDFLITLPVKHFSIVASRFISVYTEYLIISAVVFVTASAVCLYRTDAGPVFYISMAAAMLFCPALPLAVAVAVGSIINILTSKVKHKAIGETLLMMLFVVGIMVFSFKSGNTSQQLTREMIADMVEYITLVIKNTYPPAVWVSQAANGEVISLMKFTGLSMGAALVTPAVISKCFHTVSQKTHSHSASHGYTDKSVKSRTVMKTLLNREMKAYLSSTVYMTNTMVGPVMALIMAVAVMFGDISQLAAVPGIDISLLLPFVFAGTFTTMTTTAPSISMEGKEVWIIKTLPVTAKQWLNAKLGMYFIICAPFYILSETAMILALKPDLYRLTSLVMIPAVIILFSGVWGLRVNIKSHRFDWEKPEQVVKQSLSSIVGGMAGPLMSLAWGFTLFKFSDYKVILNAAICVILFAVTIALYKINNKIRTEDL